VKWAAAGVRQIAALIALVILVTGLGLRGRSLGVAPGGGGTPREAGPRRQKAEAKARAEGRAKLATRLYLGSVGLAYPEYPVQGASPPRRPTFLDECPPKVAAAGNGIMFWRLCHPEAITPARARAGSYLRDLQSRRAPAPWPREAGMETVKLWEIATGREGKHLPRDMRRRGPQSGLQPRDGKRLLSASRDNTIRVWGPWRRVRAGSVVRGFTADGRRGGNSIRNAGGFAHQQWGRSSRVWGH